MRPRIRTRLMNRLLASCLSRLLSSSSSSSSYFDRLLSPRLTACMNNREVWTASSRRADGLAMASHLLSFFGRCRRRRTSRWPVVEPTRGTCLVCKPPTRRSSIVARINYTPVHTNGFWWTPLKIFTNQRKEDEKTTTTTTTGRSSTIFIFVRQVGCGTPIDHPLVDRIVQFELSLTSYSLFILCVCVCQLSNDKRNLIQSIISFNRKWVANLWLDSWLHHPGWQS